MYGFRGDLLRSILELQSRAHMPLCEGEDVSLFALAGELLLKRDSVKVARTQTPGEI